MYLSGQKPLFIWVGGAEREKGYSFAPATEAIWLEVWKGLYVTCSFLDLLVLRLIRSTLSDPFLL